MASDKRLKDLEYNVLKKDLDSGSGHDILGTKDAGCLTSIAAIIVLILIIVVIVGFMQIGRNGPAPNCAYPGCSNRLKPGSSYCWLHSKSSTGSRKSSGGSSIGDSGSSSGNGSVIGGSSGGLDSSTKKKSKIWSGSNRTEGSSSGSSSSGGSSIGN